MLWALGAGVASRLGYWVGLGGTAVLLGCATVLFDGAPAWPGSPFRRGVAFAAALGCALAMAIAAWTLYPVIASFFPGVVEDKIGLYAAFTALPGPAAAVLLPPIIVGEELVWRGLVQEALGGRANRALGILGGALTYGLATWPCGSLLLAFTAFACGLVWSTLRALTGTVLAPIVCHLAWSILVLFVRPVRLG